MTKLTYQAPTLRAHGSVNSLTKMMTSGTQLDAPFVAGSPISSLTLS